MAACRGLVLPESQPAVKKLSNMQWLTIQAQKEKSCWERME
jgi:hypothetical protein